MCTASVILLFTFIKIAIIHSQDVIRSVSITPRFTSSNGVRVLTHIDEVIKANSDSQWRISTVHQHTWQFIILLDDTWTFNPTQKSSVSFIIQSPTIPESEAFARTVDDIILGFAATNYEYISMAIPIGNSHPENTNKIYPHCYPPNSIKSNFGEGDIATLPDYNRACDVARGDCQNWSNMKPVMPQMYNKFPLTITFINDPITDTLELQFHSLTSIIQTCVFKGFPPNQGMKIYFGGNENGQSFDVNSFDFEYRIFPTVATLPTPTPRPTANPAINPTLRPTADPTPNPTLRPSTDPTLKPSTNPTLKPSTNPTLKPSNNPTLKPSNNPTLKPSINPTDAPIRRVIQLPIENIPSGPVLWTDIYYDNMLTNKGWFTNNEVTFGSSSRHCPTTDKCVRINGCHSSRGGDSYIEKLIDISGYNSIRLKVDFKARSLEAGDKCEIWYAYGAEIDRELFAWTTNGIIYSNEIIDLPSPTDNNLKIILLANGSSKNSPCGDRCYWGDFYVQGSK